MTVMFVCLWNTVFEHSGTYYCGRCCPRNSSVGYRFEAPTELRKIFDEVRKSYRKEEQQREKVLRLSEPLPPPLSPLM
jgi:hypothetical protein